MDCKSTVSFPSLFQSPHLQSCNQQHQREHFSYSLGGLVVLQLNSVNVSNDQPSSQSFTEKIS